MRRSLAVALASGAVLVLGAVGLGVWAWFATPDAATPERIGALVGVAEGYSAVVIGLLTVVLAYVGHGALTATRAQAAEAQAANRELRVERELAVLPYLSTEAIPTPHPDGTVGLQINGRNQTPHPAIDVTVDMLAGPWHEEAADQIPIAPPSIPPVREVIGAGDLKSFLWHVKDGTLDTPVVLRVRYTSLLGAEVTQTYDLDVPGKQRGHDGWFQARDRIVRTTVAGAAPMIMRYGSRRGSEA